MWKRLMRWLFPARELPMLDLQAATRRLGGVSHVSITVEEPDILVAYRGAQVARVSPWKGGAVVVTRRHAFWAASEAELRAQVLSVLP